jgi:hypothetical protein
MDLLLINFIIIIAEMVATAAITAVIIIKSFIIINFNIIDFIAQIAVTKITTIIILYFKKMKEN